MPSILTRYRFTAPSFLTVALCFALPAFAADGTQLPAIQPTNERPAEQADPAEAVASTPKFTAGPQANWIWDAAGGESCQLQRTFSGGAKSAQLIATCDNRVTLFLNGKQIATSSEWQAPVVVDVSDKLLPGDNRIRVDAANDGGVKAFALKLILTAADGKQQYVVTDDSWQSQAGQPAKVLGKMGDAPWGNVFTDSVAPTATASARNVFNVLPGFQVELLYTVPKNSQGSWVAIAFDDRGRLIASDQGGQGLYRITPAPIGSDKPTQVEKLNVKMTGCQGMLHAFGKLYCSVNGGPGSGFYILEDTTGDDQYDKVTKVKDFRGGGEHGPHAVRLSPDGKSIYVIAGNHTDPPQNFDHSRVPKNWDEDLLLPRQWDARGHARGKLAPGGWVAKTDPEGKTWEIFSSGYRNPYDMDFNADGELFVYDADMEWDMGMPWYRPTRVTHSPSGSEFGWRSGTGKWPDYYVDSLPTTVDIGPGSPVGVTFGYGAKFPAKYQKALYVLDWTFGTMYALHLDPDGATYRGEKEEFLSRTPLPLTDAEIGPDGAMYFTVGGRNTQSELYRVRYVGDESTAPVDAKNAQFAEQRALRQQMEALHLPAGAEAIDAIWPQLSHADRYIRYAARVALEHQDVTQWQDRALQEKNPQAAIQAIVALARQGDKQLQPKLLETLGRIDLAKLTEPQRLDLLRAYQLVFIRTGEPDAATAAKLVKQFDPLYPAESDAANRELSQLLVYLNSPTVASKTLQLLERETETSPQEMAELLARNQGYGGTIAKMLADQPEIEKLHLAFVLRNLRYGWTLEERQRYFDFLDAAGRKSGGASYHGFIGNIRKEALDNASPAERAALVDKSPPPKPTELPQPKGPGHTWTIEEIASLTADGLSGRDFEQGRLAYAASRCIVCHRFDGDGGATGPDLTNVAGRFSYRDLAESLIEPSKVISDQYRGSIIETIDGKIITGRLATEDDDKLTVLIDPEDATKVVELARDQVESIEPAPVSLMPADLVNVLNEQELLDLLAYLMSRGNPNDPMFAK
ncbi:MAG: c-type cytochrome [Pirellulales bacterium]